MTGDSQPKRDFAHLAAAIVVAAVVIGAAILASPYLGAVATRTQTTTATKTGTIIATTLTTTQTAMTETGPPGQTSTFSTGSSENIVSSSATLSGITTIATASL